MVLTDTILIVAVVLVTVSVVFGWMLLRARSREQVGEQGLEVDPAARARLDRLAEELSTAGSQKTTQALVAEALDLLFEKYDKPPSA